MKKTIEINQPVYTDWIGQGLPPSVKAEIVKDQILGFIENSSYSHTFIDIYTNGMVFRSLETRESFSKRFNDDSENDNSK